MSEVRRPKSNVEGGYSRRKAQHGTTETEIPLDKVGVDLYLQREKALALT
jgi:hypothetical protein